MQIPSFYQEAAARRCDVAVQISADSSHHKKRSEKKKGTLHFYSSCFVEDRREGGSVRSKRVNQQHSGGWSWSPLPPGIAGGDSREWDA